MSDEESQSQNGDSASQNGDPAAQVRLSLDAGIVRPAPRTDGRFKPGQSGNPRGRPRRAPPEEPSLNDLPLAKSLLDGFRRKVRVREGDEVKTITVVEAVSGAQIKSALQGSPYAQARVLERALAEEVREARDLAKERQDWSFYVEMRRQEERDGETSDPFATGRIPHPDDVVIPPEGPVRFAGPVDEEEVERLKETIAYRDLLVLWEQLALRGPKSGPNDQSARVGAAELFAVALNQSIPKRFRWSTHDFVMAALQADRLILRQIRKLIRQGLQRLGRPLPRNLATPPLDVAIKTYKLCAMIVEKTRTGEWDAAAMSLEQIAERISELAEEIGMNGYAPP